MWMANWNLLKWLTDDTRMTVTMINFRGNIEDKMKNIKKKNRLFAFQLILTMLLITIFVFVMIEKNISKKRTFVSLKER